MEDELAQLAPIEEGGSSANADLEAASWVGRQSAGYLSFPGKMH